MKCILFALLLVVSITLTGAGTTQQSVSMQSEENEVTFAVISDPHIGMGELSNTNKMFHYNQDVLMWVIKEINAMNDIDFVLVLGDITKDSEPINHVLAKDLLDTLDVPYFVVPGNHDVNKTYVKGMKKGIEDFVKIYEGHGYQGERSWYSVDPVPGLHLVALDSASDPSLSDTWGGNISKEQLSWLESDLNQSQDKTIIVMSHHALINHTGKNESNWYIGNRNTVKDILRKYGVQIVFTGHLHITDIAEEDGLYDISCPATSTYPLAYRLVKIEGNNITIDTMWYPDEKVRGIAKAEFMQHGWEGTLEEMEGSFSDRYTVIELHKPLQDIKFPLPAEA
ncbi:MAG: metallophosphoesterase [Methanothrix sp.]|nr:metallophosphoesterase [Methanothrix sp.]MCX8207442.1 metallophosphoesterase [Methanothrix sp.]